jgi:hypothetical protein
VRPNIDPGTPFTNDVIIVDGMWGTGKSILSSLIGSLEGVEKKRIDYLFEYLCVGYSLGRISADLAMTLIRIQADVDQYNNLIGREVNLRPSDDSGFRNTPGSFRYLRRLIASEGEEVVDRINDGNLALLLVTHHISAVCTPLVNALSGRLFLIEVVRHPLQLVKYWTRYFEDFERSREFTLSACIDGTRVPWFALDWHDEFIGLSPIDRAIRCINQMQIAAFSPPALKRDSLPEITHDTHRLIVPFESLIAQPNLVLNDVMSFTGRARTSRTNRVFNKQKIPRIASQTGRATNIRSWLPSSALSYDEQLAELMTWITQHAKPTSIETMEASIQEYELACAPVGDSTCLYLPFK